MRDIATRSPGRQMTSTDSSCRRPMFGSQPVASARDRNVTVELYAPGVWINYSSVGAEFDRLSRRGLRISIADHSQKQGSRGDRAQRAARAKLGNQGVGDPEARWILGSGIRSVRARHPARAWRLCRTRPIAGVLMAEIALAAAPCWHWLTRLDIVGAHRKVELQLPGLSRLPPQLCVAWGRPLCVAAPRTAHCPCLARGARRKPEC